MFRFLFHLLQVFAPFPDQSETGDHEYSGNQQRSAPRRHDRRQAQHDRRQQHKGAIIEQDSPCADSDRVFGHFSRLLFHLSCEKFQLLPEKSSRFL